MFLYLSADDVAAQDNDSDSSTVYELDVAVPPTAAELEAPDRSPRIRRGPRTRGGGVRMRGGRHGLGEQRADRNSNRALRGRGGHRPRLRGKRGDSCRLYMNICIARSDFMRLTMLILCSAIHK